MIEVIILSLLCIPYLAYLIFNMIRDNIEFNMIEHIKEMRHTVERGESIETALKRISEKNDSAAKAIRGILEDQSQSLQEGFIGYSKKKRSMAFTIVANIIRSSEDGIKVNSLKQAEAELKRIRDMKRSFRDKVASPIIAVQALGFLAVPYGIYLISSIIGLQVSQLSQIYLFGVIVLFSLLDAIILDDILESLFKLPFFISLYIISVTILVPSIVRLMS